MNFSPVLDVGEARGRVKKMQTAPDFSPIR